MSNQKEETANQAKKKKEDGFISKTFQILLFLSVGYFFYRWILGDIDITSTPLSQLTLSDIGQVIFAIIVLLFFIKLVVNTIYGDKS